MILASLSQSSYGQRYALIGLCALFGGFTVLSTKAVSTLLTMQWSQVFTSVIAYPVFLCLVLTGVGQIRYLNRALVRFDSKIVIPIQFVLFNLSAIVGSAILYGDFKKASFHQIVTFLYGCAATFAGVFSESNESEFEHRGTEQSNDGNFDGATSIRAEQVASNLSIGSLGRRRATLVLPGSALVTSQAQRH
ncbi:magnesium transporter NIPA-domain-containing protein [Lentinula detonsa]|uniref:Magnesium transporter NIPA-domain-containing protein n=1 Tax=Lentinula detonsa TaxID=2804962 RepID=A0A9W8P669_9AGAR|nr:magnesium transporter NIPA-domain-containing protein [Lentinula detonsa]